MSFYDNFIFNIESFKLWTKTTKSNALLMLKTQFLLLFCFCLFGVSITDGLAQDKKARLKEDLQKAVIDSNQIQLLEALGAEFSKSHLDSALFYYEAAIQKCAQPYLLATKAHLLNEKGILLIKKGDEKALSFLALAKDYYGRVGDTLGMANVEQNIGIGYYYLKRFEEAVIHYLAALDIYKKHAEKRKMSQTLNNIAVLYRHQEKYDRAIEIYEQSLSIKKELQDSIGIGKTLMNMGSLYINTKQESLFKTYFQRAKIIFKAIKKEDLDAACHLAFGRGLIAFGTPTAAKVELEKAFTYYKKQPYLHQYEVVVHLLGKILMEEHNYKQAAELFEIGLMLNRKNARKSMMEAHLRNLGIAKFELKEYKSAYLLLEEAYQLQDSIKTEKRIAL